MQKPVISIITSNYNHEDFLPEAIESVLTQAGSFFIDYQIIDAASKDGSMEIVKLYEEKLKANCDLKQVNERAYYVARSRDYEFCRCLGISFRYVSEPDNGMYDGINKGIKTAFGDIIAYLNSDDYYLPYAFQNVADAFQKYDDAAVVYGESFQVDKQGQVTGRYPVQDVYKHKLSQQNLIDQPAAFINAKTLATHGGFNMQIANSADYEMWMRLFYAGEKFIKLTPVLAASRIYADTKTSRNRKQIHMESFAIAKHYAGEVTPEGREEFTMGLSWFGRFSWLIIRGLTWLRKKKLYVLTYLYLVLNKGKINQTVHDIFRVKGEE